MPKTIPLTRGQVAIVDDDMHAFLSRWNWYCSGDGYAVRGMRATGQYQNVLLHRVVAHLIFGEIPEGYMVDHRDGDRLNCQTSNIRLCTNSENQMNRRKTAGRTSTFRGVYWKKPLKKWAAKIAINGKGKHLGYFNDEQEAARCFDQAAIQYHGEFARLNFPESLSL